MVWISYETHLDSWLLEWSLGLLPSWLWQLCQIVTVCECCTGASGSSAGGLLRGPSCWEFPIMGDAQPVPRKCKCNSNESAHFHIGSLGTYTELSYNPLLCSTFLNRIDLYIYISMVQYTLYAPLLVLLSVTPSLIVPVFGHICPLSEKTSFSLLFQLS